MILNKPVQTQSQRSSLINSDGNFLSFSISKFKLHWQLEKGLNLLNGTGWYGEINHNSVGQFNMTRMVRRFLNTLVVVKNIYI